MSGGNWYFWHLGIWVDTMLGDKLTKIKKISSWIDVKETLKALQDIIQRKSVSARRHMRGAVRESTVYANTLWCLRLTTPLASPARCNTAFITHANMCNSF